MFKDLFADKGLLHKAEWLDTLDKHAGIGLWDAVFHEGDAAQPCGIVAQAAPAPGGGFDAIVSMQIAAAAHGCTNAHGAVMATRPASMPLTIMPGSGLPIRFMQ